MAAFSKPRSVLPMLFALLFLLQLTVAAHHGHQHVHRSNDPRDAQIKGIHETLAERQAQFIGIVGATPRQSTAERLEIRTLAANPDQWNLYLLGMERFMAKPNSDPLSYYQIAGIHGRPYVSWNNFPTPLVNLGGFCPHGQGLFGSWHRPYLAIYEQAWYQSVQEVIRTFPQGQQQRLFQVASNMRIPYWDWAKDPGRGQPAVPTVVRDQWVTVTKPSGPVAIQNPLYSYYFAGNVLPREFNGGPWNSFPRTLRRPVANPTRSNNNDVNGIMGYIRTSLRDRVFGLFAARPVPNWGAVSTSQIGARPANRNNVDSFESIHDTVHTSIGGESGGHMFSLDVSAYDPLFWVHHAQIDRLLAMFQLTTPNTYVARTSIPRPMAQWNVGEVKDSSSPLKPFTKNAAGEYFTSQDVRYTERFGYYYAETRANSSQAVYNAVNTLYGTPGALRKRTIDLELDTPIVNIEVGLDLPHGSLDVDIEAPGHKNDDEPEAGDEDIASPYQGRPIKEGEDNYVLSIIASKYALAGSYSIACFLADPESDSSSPVPSNSSTPTSTSSGFVASPSGFTTDGGPLDDPVARACKDPNFVGTYSVLGMTNGDAPNATNPLVTEGSLPLTTALQKKESEGKLASLAKKDVDEYLAKYLTWKVYGPGYVEIPADQVPNLHIGVEACPVAPAAPGEMPSYGSYVKKPEITKGKPAGEPYQHVLTPIQVVHPGEAEDTEEPYFPVPSTPSDDVSPTKPAFPYPTAPEHEGGYCTTKTTVKYVDQNGNFLYEAMS